MNKAKGSISHTEASIIFTSVLERGKQFVKDEGFLFPGVYALSKDKPIVLEMDYPCVINCHCDDHPGSLGIYKSLVGVDGKTYEGKPAVQFVAETVARTYNPDIIGIFMMGLYKKVPRKDAHRISLQMDPEATHVLHLCFYKRGDPTPMMMVVPYVNRGAIDKSELDPEQFDPDEEGPFDVTFISMPWTADTDDLPPLLEYPYG